MKIDDILKREKFKELDLFLTTEMDRLAGKKLVEKMMKVMENEKHARDWFYTPLIPLNGKRPYDYCKEKKFSEIENLLERIENGIYS